MSEACLLATLAKGAGATFFAHGAWTCSRGSSTRRRHAPLTLIRGNTYNSCAVEPIGRRMRRSARPPSARAESTGVFFDTDSGGRLHEYEMIVVMNPEIAE